MANKRNTKLPKNDFAPEEDLDICGFSSDEKIPGTCIATFSFNDNSSYEVNAAPIIANTNTATPEVKNNFKNNDNNIKNNLFNDNRRTPIVNGCAPPIDGEFLAVKRTYMLRASTVRKINELKSIHPELNTYVSTIVDIAIAHYYDHIVNGDGIQ